MEYVKSVTDDYKPWKRGVAWQAVALEAAIAIAIGAYFLIAPDSANSTIRFLLAALLIIASLIDIKAGFSQFYSAPDQRNNGAPFLLVRGGAGVTLGIFYFVVTRYDYMTESDARYVLGFGMVAYAIIGFIAMIMAMLKGQFHWPALLSNLLFLLVGGVLVYNRHQTVTDSTAVEYLGVAAIIGGICLAVYAWYLRNEQKQERAAAPASTASSTAAMTPPVAPSPSSLFDTGVKAEERLTGAADSLTADLGDAASKVIDDATKG